MNAATPKPAVSAHKKPADVSEAEWQRELRKRSIPVAKEASFVIKYLDGEHPVFADYSVENPTTGGRYKVALRTAEPGSPNFCSCLDFKTNLLGTCKHIEALLGHITKNKKLAALLQDDFRPTYSSVYLQYGETRRVMLRVGEHHREKYQQLAKSYFDDSGALLPENYNRINRFLTNAALLGSDFRCYPDAMEFIIAARESRARLDLIARKADDTYLDSLLKATLYPYQKEGILFAARAGRCLIADDMGLGKTIQAIASAEFFKKECGISSVLIICPTSLKYQWQSEIQKFTDSSVVVIEGDPPRRKAQYKNTEATYKIISYGAALADLDEIQKLAPDLVILDEAQRIKNWQTKTAQAVKKIESTYAIVLTGTPIENKLEELYSIVQFIDPFKLGPLYRFLSEHQIHDESGKVTGYRDLNRIHDLLSDIVIRRTKKTVLAQLPARTDKHLFVPLTKQQADIHTEYADNVAQLVAKWKRMGFLDEKDRLRLMLALNCMRMVSDSTFVLDQETRFDTKITELLYILDDVFAVGAEKVVIFSQWERMTRLVKQELENRQVGYAYLHGGVPSNKRKALLDTFRDDPKCRVFLSTDAGGVGLNLQAASLLINLDIPWNPAVLEQRIGRIHRHGQTRAVNIINLVSSESIEERMLDVLAFKASLFAGVLDNGSDQIFMGDSKFKRFMQSVEEVAAVPQTDPAGAAMADELLDELGQEPPSQESVPSEQAASPQPASIDASDGTPEPVAQLFDAAGAFFGTLAKTLADPAATQQLVSSIMEKDKVTGKTYLKIPVEKDQLLGNALDALAGLAAAFRR